MPFRGPLTESLQALARELGVSDYVIFCGVRNDVEHILSISDFTVLPSLTEGLGLALLEAQAAGRPVVASNVGGIPELITHGVNGLLVGPHDVRGLVDAIGLLLKDGALLQRMGRQSADRAELFDVRRGVAQTISLYEELIWNNGRYKSFEKSP